MHMLHNYFLMKPVYWIIPWIMQSFAYYFVLKKMGLRRWTAAVPFLAEREFSTVLFRRMWSFWRPFLITAIFVIGAYYLGPSEGAGHVYMLVAFIIYGFFLLRLYHRIAKSFGKPIWYTLLIWIFPLLFLAILGLGKSKYTPLEFRPEMDLGRFGNWIRRAVIFLASAAEIIAIVLVVGLITVRTLPPRMLANSLIKDNYEKTKDIVSDGKALSREDTMGITAADIEKLPASRERFFPDHSNDKSVVVMEYIIGSNLENKVGMASSNILMMKDATKRGDALTFVLECGGSKRWFTDGVTESAYGRYEIKNGELKKTEALDNLATMEDPDHLAEFIKSTKEKYPADRYMLILWDHGGGIAFGYGVDDLNHRTDTKDFQGIRASEVADAIAKSGVKFDVVGFDACLMQDIEIASALEPYADFYLASEETEGGLGWYYTDAFGMLAEKPGTSSEDFGKAIISTYDQFNTITNDNKPNTGATLSFVDLTLIKPAYEKLNKLYEKTDAAIRKDPADFADFGLAAMNSYTFTDKIQLDAIDLVDKLDDTDINDSICSQKEKDDVANALKGCVMYRNKNSAKGVNGLAVALPYEQIYYYGDTSDELKRLSQKTQRNLFNDVFSIIAVQKKNEIDKAKKTDANSLQEFILSISGEDYTKADWYVKGFEDYDPVSTLIDIPLKDTGEGYLPELPEKTWGIIADAQTMAYQKAEDGTMRYLGSQHIGGTDAEGHPLVDMDDTWIHMNGRLVSYESKVVRETDDGVVYTGDVKARLNDEEDILIHIEWNPVKDGSEEEFIGKITGYELVNDENAFMKKGSEQLEYGDRIDFLFDYYDNEGKLVKTEKYGRSLIVTKQGDLKVSEEPLEECDIEFLGILTDVYQRDILTETLEAHIGK